MYFDIVDFVEFLKEDQEHALAVARLSARQLAQLAEHLRELRSKGQLPLRELAKRTGLSPGTLGELEQGRHEPRLGTMLALREALGVGSIEELLGAMPSQRLSEEP